MASIGELGLPIITVPVICGGIERRRQAMKWLQKLAMAWRLATPRIARSVSKAERSLHIPYFGAVAWHYGPLSPVGTPATALLVASVGQVLAELQDKDSGNDSANLPS